MELAHHSRNLLLLPLLSRGGLVAWLLLLIVLPAGLVERLFLAGPLLLVPMLLSLLPDRPVVRRVGTRDLAAWSFVAAGPLGAALILPPSPAAAGLALGWIAVVLVCGLVALRHGLPLLPRLFVPSRAHELAGYAALGFVAVAGAFLLADRLGLSVLGFRSPYTLLGAVHYTFAGFGLLASVAVLAGDAPSRRHWLAALGVIGGMTITAMGMIVGVALVNWAGVVVLAGVGGGATIGVLASASEDQLRPSARLALRLAALALGIGLAMGVLWASSTTFGFSFVGIDAMARIHGALNATAVVTIALALAVGRQKAR